ncbi:ABC transporter ATP-binding protein [Luteimicrobium xylanilyticum]|uniref:Cytochrome c bioproteinis ATP-binding export protein CcmA n=1 Tax=Luteimicrobium xylanilyticum TaxID=1133546 RepID=A0A5P9Q9U8_9MICO|nr:ABC transporter ATP-binding protein [Luteimicrobium xylanilyticum]QFU97842.1 Cytochrome c bioproteinis ATP-binding export protein CcmA [Luteimicrobium xylanilyticum]
MSLSGTGLTLTYGATVALAGASVTVAPGEVVALVGPSGSGKTSLLYCLSGLARPSSGQVLVGDIELTALDDAGLVAVRREHFGFVFQFSELVPELTLAENVALPLELLKAGRRDTRRRVAELLERLGIGDLGGRYPAQVSGGQAQRAAVARALVHRPAVVFADEPTGSLDSANTDTVLSALVELSRDTGSSIVLVTHDDKVATAADRRVFVRDGFCTDEVLSR